jgi:hypothetical protein
MKENARQGFWNGARHPLGYTAVEAERRGARVKKKLAVDPVEAEQVRLIFKLFLEGHQGSGPMGIKAMAGWLNERGHTTRTGGRWGTGRLHAVLSNPVYAGRLRFNVKDSRRTVSRPRASTSIATRRPSWAARRSITCRRCSSRATPASTRRGP